MDTSTGGPSPVYPEIPREALREGLMNAFAHRDWQTLDAVIIDIYNDAVEITSPGWFIEGQDPESHLSGENNSPLNRNPLISRTLYRSGDIEAYGTGIKRIKDECDEVGMKVEYVKVPNGTKLIFHRNDPFGQSLVIDKVSRNTDGDTLSDTINGTIKMNERARKAFDVIKRNPNITSAEISEETGLSLSTVKRALSELQELGLITREGSRKTGRWIVKSG